MTKVILASASPRRHELLSQIGVRFEVRVPDIDESPIEGEDPFAYVRRLAIGKATAISAAPGELVIAADTTVDLDSVIMGKPIDNHDATSMLRRLSGQTHRVHTGVAVRLGARELVDVCTTSVTFVSLDEATIDWYISTGEPLGKAGSYALQGAGAALVSGVDGSVSNVIGLPLHLVVDLARRLDVTLLTERDA
ncbi:MAG: nucleoside triphosphate pyrophosphatase [Ilumatobacteraceae bacterium]|jgi:septum formation protein